MPVDLTNSPSGLFAALDSDSLSSFDDTLSHSSCNSPLSDPFHFLYTVLHRFNAEFSNLPLALQNSPQLLGLRHAFAANQTALDFILLLNNLSSLTPPSLAASSSSSVFIPPSICKPSLPLPPEIINRILSFVCGDNDCIVPFSDSSVLNTLFSCSLINSHWNKQASLVLWKRIDLVDVNRFGRWLLASCASQGDGRCQAKSVRLISISGNDVDLALLDLASKYVTNLQSLEFRRIMGSGWTSYQMLAKLKDKFPKLKSLQAYSIPSAAWKDLLSLCVSCKELCNLDVSFRALDRHPDNPSTLSAADVDRLFSGLPQLRSLSLWMIALPGDSACLSLSKSCCNLRAVRLDDCENISMDSLVYIWNSCPQIETIMMRLIQSPLTINLTPCAANNNDVTNHRHQQQYDTLQSRPTLHTLIFDSCWYSDALIGSIGRAAPFLQTLYLEAAAKTLGFPPSSISNTGIRMLADHQTQLQSLSVVGFSFASAEVIQLLRANPNLVGLNLAKLRHDVYLGDQQLLEMAPYFAKLEALELYMQSHLSESTIIQALQYCANLKSLGLSNIPVSDALLYAIPHLCPNLERIDVGMEVGEEMEAELGEESPKMCTPNGFQYMIDNARRVHTVAPLGINKECVIWGSIYLDEPIGQDRFSEFKMWRKEVRKVAKASG
ncbi:hypothetical protein HK096_004186, partial [Nowakowskiella sp. JEL0078]